jgi:hypothetical protein
MTAAERAAMTAQSRLLADAAQRAVWGKPLDEMTEDEVREHNRVAASHLAMELEAERAHAARVAAPRPLAKVLEFKPRGV